MKTKLLLFLSLFFLIYSCNQTTEVWKVESPDKKLQVEIFQNENDGSLSYQVKINKGAGTVLALEPSPLGIEREDQSFKENLRFKSVQGPDFIATNYEMLSGKEKSNEVEANQILLNFENENGAPVQLIFRAYNKGFAMRYVFPGQSDELLTVTGENTGFNLPEPGYKWIHPYDTIAPWSPAYEQFYQDMLEIGTKSPDNRNGWSFPALFHTNNLWILISEADLDQSYCGMHLTDNPEGGLYTLRFPEPGEAMGLFDEYPSWTLPWQTPWRFAVISENPGDIVESNLVHDLSPGSAINNTGWIKPGIASWSWWSESDSPRDFARMKEFIDFTKQFGWDYFLVDANWNNMEGGNLEQLADYANKQNVGLLVWYNSGGPHNEITEQPRNLMHIDSIRKAEFKWLSDIGVKGVKVDFFQSDKQEIITQYIDILKDASEYNILVNFHGCTMPRGWSKTWPNLLTLESVRGAEAYKFDRNYPEYAPIHNTILPFTRNVIGPMDYTPVTYSESTYPHLTSHAHETALAVIFESGIQHFADRFESYLALPEYVQEFLKTVPVTWEEIRFLDGYPGDFVILARRSGENWYIAGINGQDKELPLEIDLGFTKRDSLRLIADGDNPKSFEYQILEPQKGKIKLKLPPRGGFVAY